MKYMSNGWSKEEDALLLKEIDEARGARKPLSRAFERTAQLTGRQANSVRNHYYSSHNDRRESRSFVPFTTAETRRLIREILVAQSKGESVRKCTLRLGNGDSKLTLRYQNKYRSIIVNKPYEIELVRRELENEGIEVPRKPLKREAARDTGELAAAVEALTRLIREGLMELQGRNTTA